MSKYVQICPNTSKYVQLCPNTSKYVKICPNMFKHVQICANVLKNVEMCPNVSKYVQTSSAKSKHVQMIPNMSKTTKNDKICPNMFKYIQTSNIPASWTHKPVISNAFQSNSYSSMMFLRRKDLRRTVWQSKMYETPLAARASMFIRLVCWMLNVDSFNKEHNNRGFFQRRTCWASLP